MELAKDQAWAALEAAEENYELALKQFERKLARPLGGVGEEASRLTYCVEKLEEAIEAANRLGMI